ncbi:MAG: histidine phosphatase family protein [Chloroflexi bacterium]|nr:histidine phosphatase family protein [Chloroflexota bacterium]
MFAQGRRAESGPAANRRRVTMRRACRHCYREETMTRQLLLMRHAKSRRDEGVADEARGLTKRGKDDARAMGAWLADGGLVPDALLTSPAKRARSTARRVAEACGYKGVVAVVPDLYMGDADACIAAFSQLPPSVGRALVIGHNPLLEELVLFLSARSVHLPTATVACVSFDVATWEGICSSEGELRFVKSPRG